jgi:hypothetical protein
VYGCIIVGIAEITDYAIGFRWRVGVGDDALHLLRDQLHALPEFSLSHASCRFAGALSLRKRGRLSYAQKAAQEDSQPKCKRFWCAEKNFGTSFGDTTLFSSTPYYFYCSDCIEGVRHVLYITCKTAERKAGEGELSCLICNPSKRRSRLEGHVHQVLQDYFPTFEYLPECRALRGFSGAIDFTIRAERFLIQVDGPTHYLPVEISDLQETTQAEVDTRCNTIAVDQGWNILRIHEFDLPSCKYLIEQLVDVIRGCKEFIKADVTLDFGSVTWSPSFGRRPEVKVMRRVEEAVPTL